MDIHFTIPVDPNALAIAGTVLGYLASGIAGVAGWYRRSGTEVETNGERINAAFAVLLWPAIAACLAVAPALLAIGWTVGKIAGKPSASAPVSAGLGLTGSRGCV